MPFIFLDLGTSSQRSKTILFGASNLRKNWDMYEKKGKKRGWGDVTTDFAVLFCCFLVVAAVVVVCVCVVLVCLLML